ncbi:hypothetical protein JVU11DRAFT_8266 [Chiua virens]|nr:hypothetical protein JVU11DRAFT_8266 [Chiua virens]
MNYLAVPSFPKGLNKADYQPMSEYLGIPLPPSSVPNHNPRPESPAIEQQIHSSKGKERERSVPCSHTQDEQPTPPDAAKEADLCVVLDVFDEPTVLSIEDDGTYPPLTPLDLGINTRFYFIHAWRSNASRLQIDEPDWPLKILGKPSIWAMPVVPPAPRSPETTGYVTSEQLRSWELVPSEGSHEKQTKDFLEEQTESHTIDADHLPLPDGCLPVPNAADPPSSSPTVSQGLLSTAVDMVHDMNQYFDGLGDSPRKQLPLRQQLGLTHTFRPHLLQSMGHARMNAFGLDFPPLELEPRLADAGGNECFLGVPPSPTTEDIGPSIATQSTDSPFEPASYFPASPSNAFPREAPAGAWGFEQGAGPLPDSDLLPSDQVSPVVSGTIDPSLLGLEKQPQTPLVVRKDATPKKRSRLPEPVIYVRRPMDPSSLPLLPGKRSVQIKYRDAEGSSMTPSTRARSNEMPLNAVDSPAEASTNDGDDLPRVKRRSLPSRKVVQAQAASESNSDYIPEASTSKSNKSKPKRPRGKDKESVSDIEDQETETAPTKTYCHQCRNKTARPKMMCSNVTNIGNICGKRFCNRCILYRYPDITFDEHSAGFLCPVCTNTCNCSYCSRNRGEEFVSMRLGGGAASLFTAKVTLVRDAGSGKPLPHGKSPPPRELTVQPSASANASRTTTPTPEPSSSAIPIPSQFWAHVYGMEGERMGSAFMTREHMARLRVGASPSGKTASVPKSGPEKKGKTRRKKTRTGPRVFIGEPQSSWKVRGVRDLEPMAGRREGERGAVCSPTVLHW